MNPLEALLNNLNSEDMNYMFQEYFPRIKQLLLFPTSPNWGLFLKELGKHTLSQNSDTCQVVFGSQMKARISPANDYSQFKLPALEEEA